MKSMAIAPMPQEFALAHAGRVAFFNMGKTTKSKRQKLLENLAEEHHPGAGSLPMIGQLAAVSSISMHDYARQHTFVPVLRVAEYATAPAIHGCMENYQVAKLVGPKLHTKKVHLCRQCALDDVAHWSFSWFRRTHNLAGVEICPVHGQPLHRVTAPDPFSHLPQHWVDSGDIEQVACDPTSESERLFQARLHATYEIFMERDRPFELLRVRRVLAKRARELGLRICDPATKPPLSDYVLERTPFAWVQRHWPTLCSKEKGESFAALDRLPTSAITPGTGFAYALALATAFETAEAASHLLARPAERHRKNVDQIEKPRYSPEFWRNDYLSVLKKMGGNLSATAHHLGLDRHFLTRKTRNLGIPSLKGAGTSPRWRAVQRFSAGESLAAACSAEGVDVRLVESLLRTASASLVELARSIKAPTPDTAAYSNLASLS